MSFIVHRFVSVAIRTGLLILGVALFFWGCGSKKAVEPAGNQSPVLASLTAAPPVINLGQASVLKAIASDPDGDPLTYFWIPTLGNIVGSGPKVHFSSGICCTGTIRIFLEVRDNHDGKAESHVDVVVLP